MSRNFENLKFAAEKVPCRGRFDKKVRLDRFDFQFKAETAKEFAVGDHWCGQRVATDLAAESAFYFRNVLNMIDVTVGEEQ